MVIRLGTKTMMNTGNRPRLASGIMPKKPVSKLTTWAMTAVVQAQSFALRKP